METIVYIAVGFALGWVAGATITAVKQAMAFKNILNDLGVTTEQLIKLKNRIDAEDAPDTESAAEPEIEICLERVGTMIYAYRKATSEFLAQGENREELVARLVERFARGEGARLIIREEDGADLVKTL